MDQNSKNILDSWVGESTPEEKLLSSLKKVTGRYTTKVVYNKGQDTLGARIPEPWWDFVKETLHSHRDPELRQYSDIVIDAVGNWIINELEKNPELENTTSGHKVKMQMLQDYLDELDGFCEQRKEVLDGLKRRGYIPGLEVWLKDTTVAYYRYVENDAPQSFLNDVNELLAQARRLLDDYR